MIQIIANDSSTTVHLLLFNTVGQFQAFINSWDFYLFHITTKYLSRMHTLMFEGTLYADKITNMFKCTEQLMKT